MVNVSTGEILEVGTDLVPLSEAGIENASDPAVYVELALARAKSWIADALQHGDIDQIVEIKAAGEAIRSYTAQRQLGKDVELSALEIIRRAERGLGAAIRRGQEAGEIAKRGYHPPSADQTYTRTRNGVEQTVHIQAPDLQPKLPSPGSFFTNAQEWSETLTIADTVTDERFEQVIADAKEEGNLSRANVLRKVKGEPVPKATRPEHLRGTRHLDSARIIGQTVDLVGNASDLGSLLDQVDFTTLDPAQLEEWVRSLSKSISALRSLKNRLEKERTQHV